MASSLGEIIDRTLAHCATAVSGSTTLRGFVPVSAIRPQDLPHMQAFAVARRRVGQLDGRQQQHEVDFSVLYSAQGATQEEMIADFDLIETQIQTDNTLAGTCEWIEISEVIIGENPDNANEMVHMLLTFTAELLYS